MVHRKSSGHMFKQMEDKTFGPSREVSSLGQGLEDTLQNISLLASRLDCSLRSRLQPLQNLASDKSVVMQKCSGEFGFRIHGSRPVVVSAIEPGTPAELSGLEVGDIIISINGARVLESSHGEVVKIAHAGSDELRLEVASTSSVLSLPDRWSRVREGAIWRRSDTSGSWCLRWAVLKADGSLYLFKRPEDVHPVCGLSLAEASVTPTSDCGREMALAVQFEGSTEPVTLAAESEEEYTGWLEALRTVLHESSACRRLWGPRSVRGTSIVCMRGTAWTTEPARSPLSRGSAAGCPQRSPADVGGVHTAATQTESRRARRVVNDSPATVSGSNVVSGEGSWEGAELDCDENTSATDNDQESNGIANDACTETGNLGLGSSGPRVGGFKMSMTVDNEAMLSAMEDLAAEDTQNLVQLKTEEDSMEVKEDETVNVLPLSEQRNAPLPSQQAHSWDAQPPGIMGEDGRSIQIEAEETDDMIPLEHTGSDTSCAASVKPPHSVTSGAESLEVIRVTEASVGEDTSFCTALVSQPDGNLPTGEVGSLGETDVSAVVDETFNSHIGESDGINLRQRPVDMNLTADGCQRSGIQEPYELNKVAAEHGLSAEPGEEVLPQSRFVISTGGRCEYFYQENEVSPEGVPGYPQSPDVSANPPAPDLSTPDIHYTSVGYDVGSPVVEVASFNSSRGVGPAAAASTPLSARDEPRESLLQPREAVENVHRGGLMQDGRGRENDNEAGCGCNEVKEVDNETRGNGSEIPDGTEECSCSEDDGKFLGGSEFSGPEKDETEECSAASDSKAGQHQVHKWITNQTYTVVPRQKHWDTEGSEHVEETQSGCKKLDKEASSCREEELYEVSADHDEYSENGPHPEDGDSLKENNEVNEEDPTWPHHSQNELDDTRDPVLDGNMLGMSQDGDSHATGNDEVSHALVEAEEETARSPILTVDMDHHAHFPVFEYEISKPGGFKDGEIRNLSTELDIPHDSRAAALELNQGIIKRDVSRNKIPRTITDGADALTESQKTDGVGGLLCKNEPGSSERGEEFSRESSGSVSPTHGNRICEDVNHKSSTSQEGSHEGYEDPELDVYYTEAALSSGGDNEHPPDWDHGIPDEFALPVLSTQEKTDYVTSETVASDSDLIKDATKLGHFDVDRFQSATAETSDSRSSCVGAHPQGYCTSKDSETVCDNVPALLPGGIHGFDSTNSSGPEEEDIMSCVSRLFCELLPAIASLDAETTEQGLGSGEEVLVRASSSDVMELVSSEEDMVTAREGAGTWSETTALSYVTCRSCQSTEAILNEADFTDAEDKPVVAGSAVCDRDQDDLGRVVAISLQDLTPRPLTCRDPLMDDFNLKAQSDDLGPAEENGQRPILMEGNDADLLSDNEVWLSSSEEATHKGSRVDKGQPIYVCDPGYDEKSLSVECHSGQHNEMTESGESEEERSDSGGLDGNKRERMYVGAGPEDEQAAMSSGRNDYELGGSSIGAEIGRDQQNSASVGEETKGDIQCLGRPAGARGKQGGGKPGVYGLVDHQEVERFVADGSWINDVLEERPTGLEDEHRYSWSANDEFQDDQLDESSASNAVKVKRYHLLEDDNQDQASNNGFEDDEEDGRSDCDGLEHQEDNVPVSCGFEREHGDQNAAASDPKDQQNVRCGSEGLEEQEDERFTDNDVSENQRDHRIISDGLVDEDDEMSRERASEDNQKCLSDGVEEDQCINRAISDGIRDQEDGGSVTDVCDDSQQGVSTASCVTLEDKRQEMVVIKNASEKQANVASVGLEEGKGEGRSFSDECEDQEDERVIWGELKDQEGDVDGSEASQRDYSDVFEDDQQDWRVVSDEPDYEEYNDADSCECEIEECGRCIRNEFEENQQGDYDGLEYDQQIFDGLGDDQRVVYDGLEDDQQVFSNGLEDDEQVLSDGLEEDQQVLDDRLEEDQQVLTDGLEDDQQDVCDGLEDDQQVLGDGMENDQQDVCDGLEDDQEHKKSVSDGLDDCVQNGRVITGGYEHHQLDGKGVGGELAGDQNVLEIIQYEPEDDHEGVRVLGSGSDGRHQNDNSVGDTLEVGRANGVTSVHIAGQQSAWEKCPNDSILQVADAETYRERADDVCRNNHETGCSGEEDGALYENNECQGEAHYVDAISMHIKYGAGIDDVKYGEDEVELERGGNEEHYTPDEVREPRDCGGEFCRYRYHEDETCESHCDDECTAEELVGEDRDDASQSNGDQSVSEEECVCDTEPKKRVREDDNDTPESASKRRHKAPGGRPDIDNAALDLEEVLMVRCRLVHPASPQNVASLIPDNDMGAAAVVACSDGPFHHGQSASPPVTQKPDPYSRRRSLFDALVLLAGSMGSPKPAEAEDDGDVWEQPYIVTADATDKATNEMRSCASFEEKHCEEMTEKPALLEEPVIEGGDRPESHPGELPMGSTEQHIPQAHQGTAITSDREAVSSSSVRCVTNVVLPNADQENIMSDPPRAEVDSSAIGRSIDADGLNNSGVSPNNSRKSLFSDSDCVELKQTCGGESNVVGANQPQLLDAPERCLQQGGKHDNDGGMINLLDARSPRKVLEGQETVLGKDNVDHDVALGSCFGVTEDSHVKCTGAASEGTANLKVGGEETSVGLMEEELYMSSEAAFGTCLEAVEDFDLEHYEQHSSHLDMKVADTVEGNYPMGLEDEDTTSAPASQTSSKKTSSLKPDSAPQRPRSAERFDAPIVLNRSPLQSADTSNEDANKTSNEGAMPASSDSLPTLAVPEDDETRYSVAEPSPRSDADDEPENPGWSTPKSRRKSRDQMPVQCAQS